MKAAARSFLKNKIYFGTLLIIICVLFFVITIDYTPLSAQSTKDIFDDFESGSLNWNLDEGWYLTKIDNNEVLEGTGHKWATLRGRVWDNNTLTGKFKISQGTIHFNYRHNTKSNGVNRYFIGVSSTEIYLNKQIGNKFSDLTNASLNLDHGWHKIEIRAYAGLINIYIDDMLYLIYNDSDFIKSGSIAFEALENTDCILDDIKITKTSVQDVITQPKLGQMNIAAHLFVPDITNTGDLILKGKEVKIIENLVYLQQGNIYINDESKLIIRNSQFVLGRGDLPTIHTYINVGEKAALEIENSTIVPECPKNKMGALVVIRNYGKMEIIDSPTEIHLLEMYDHAQLNMVNSKMVYTIGGLLQIHGGNTRLVNSTIGALGLSVPENTHLDLCQIKSGVYFEKWDIHEIISDVNYNLILEQTNILKDELEPGPYERGWLFFPDPSSHVRIANSELRKVFIELKRENAAFDNLKIGKPSSLQYRDIQLNNIIMRGQWPFVITDSNLTINNSDYLFLQPSGQTNLNLVNSHMVEFIPRDFFGTISFENCTWTNAGEIIGGQAYHSMANNFTIKGSVKIAPELREHMQWQDALVTREYDAVITNHEGNPLKGVFIKINGHTYITDNTGKAKFSLHFNQYNYNQLKKIEVFIGDKRIAQKDIDFFTDTPIIINNK